MDDPGGIRYCTIIALLGEIGHTSHKPMRGRKLSVAAQAGVGLYAMMWHWVLIRTLEERTKFCSCLCLLVEADLLYQHCTKSPALLAVI